MKVLFIGGTGVISTACSKQMLKKGVELYLLNRGRSKRGVPGAQILEADIHNDSEVSRKLEGMEFDVVVNWIAFEPADIERDLERFKGKVSQYIFISSASAYQTPPAILPVTENTPLENPYWDYSQKKIACERRLVEACEKDGFPVTIVRPSHTYDKTFIPLPGRFTVVNRMLQGKQVIVHGDGTSLWTLTHSSDFAVGFGGLIGNENAIGEDFHITSDEWLSWNQIYEIVADAFSTPLKTIHIPSDFISSLDKEYGAGLLGDKAHSMIFDNSKIRSCVPEFNPEISLRQGIQEVRDYHMSILSKLEPDEVRDRSTDNIIQHYSRK